MTIGSKSLGVKRVQRDENRRVGHAHAVFDQGFECAVPIATEVDVVVCGIRRRHALHARNPQETTRAVLAVTRNPRCVDATEQGAIRDRQIWIAHHRVGDDSLSAA
ncbi:MAG: hypothetical protein EBX87_06575, partial [Actinobacteria bacterium]|nr:hypothetical protein [Actinomycetota bacterium]